MPGTFRVRVIKSHGETPFHLQVSSDNLTWITIDSGKEFDPMLDRAKSLAETIKLQWKIQATHVLWKVAA